MKTTSTAIPCLAVMVLALGVAMTPRPVQACGGTFCNGPNPTPVDQTGENILFVWEGDSVEAHIQIQYMGEPTEFGWVIPLQSLPEFSVGSEPLFTALLNGSVPTIAITNTFDDCSDPGGDDGDGGDEGAGGETGSASDTDPTGSNTGGVEVLQEIQVGAFAIDVIQGTDAQAVYDWLEANEYQQDPDALPILQEYIDEGFIFGAVKLVGGVDTDQIHPIVLRFDGSEPCVPLRLTRIAAVDNMAVRSFFLGDDRMVPSNYRHVLVNQVKLDWAGQPPAMNYNEVVTLAVDEENADGRAFVTEYAGPSTVVDTSAVYNPGWDPSAYQAIDPATQLADLLQQQGFVDCFGENPPNFAPGWLHPLIEPLLGEFITFDGGELLDGVCGGGFDATLWDGDMFAQQMTLRIIEPGMHAADVVAQNPYLTRMFTTISPGEMTVDPMFYENPDLPEVTNQLAATRRFLCNGDNVWTLPDGRQVYLPAGAPWPEFPDVPEGEAGMMDSAELVAAMPPAGAPMPLTENTPRIDAVVMAHNEQFDWPGGAMPDTGGTDTAEGGSVDDTGGTGDGGQDGDGGSDSGCGCASDRPADGSAALLLLGSLAALRRRRRA